jgi:hypothetical protein
VVACCAEDLENAGPEEGVEKCGWRCHFVMICQEGGSSELEFRCGPFRNKSMVGQRGQVYVFGVKMEVC